MALVPIVDLRPWFGGSDAEQRAVAREVDHACRTLGFMQIIGHPIERAIIDAMLEASDRFFALPLATKRRSCPDRPGLNRGYAAVESEALAYSLGVEASVPDRFEAFNIGPERVPEDAWHRDAPHDFFAPNLWPRDLPELRPALVRYFDGATELALTLTDIFAPALGLADGFFRPFVDRSTLTLRVLHYEQRAGDPPPRAGQQRMGAHTDYGVVTVLYADAEPGLQIHAPDGTWHDVIPEPGALLVNLGDLTAKWTNDAWRSTLHRVAMPGGGGARVRRSAALFLDANYDARIECLPTCRSATQPPKYPPVLAGDHLIAKLLGPRVGAPSKAVGTADERLRGA